MGLLKGVVRLKHKRDIPRLKFLKQGLPWVYSNELQKPAQGLVPGDWVSLETFEGEALGYGYYNPHSLIAFRIFERAAFRTDDQVRALFFKRLDGALVLRQKAYPEIFKSGKPCLRLAYGESDGVPGLIIDLFHSAKGGVAVIQCHAAGADQFITWAQAWLMERLGITAGVVRNDLDVRKREQVEQKTYEWGDVSKDVYAMEGDLRFYFDVREGQKTGFFYDHRDNRIRLAQMSVGFKESIKAIDYFSYVGGWGLQIAKQNSKAYVTCVDVSKTATEFVLRNAEENGLKDRVEILVADVFKDESVLKDKKYQVVVSDPPALSSSAKHAEESKRAREKCFALGVRTMTSEGLIALASCSYHLTWDDFYETCRRAGQRENRFLQTVYSGGQGSDHPVLSSMPESRYIKCGIYSALDGNLG